MDIKQLGVRRMLNTLASQTLLRRAHDGRTLSFIQSLAQRISLMQLL